MDLSSLKSTFEGRVPHPEGEYKTFSVLVPLIEISDELHLIFEVRSENLKTQPKEICFPGGKMEKGETPLQCAIRETCEELNLSATKINIFGPLDFLVLPYNLVLHPFLGSLNDTTVESIDFSEDEVSDIFSVPLRFFLENPPLSYPIEIQTITGQDFPYHLVDKGEDYNWKSGKYPVYFYVYEEYVIWGITARIIKNLIDILQN